MSSRRSSISNLLMTREGSLLMFLLFSFLLLGVVVTGGDSVAASSTTTTAETAAAAPSCDGARSSNNHADPPQCSSPPADSLKDAAEQNDDDDDDVTSTTTTTTTAAASAVPDDCKIVMAPSSAFDGWGIFTLRDMARGMQVLDGDVILQVIDMNINTNSKNKNNNNNNNNNKKVIGISKLLREYMWSAEETGGYYEGQSVMSVIPGVGMLANGMMSNMSNVLPFVPWIDEGGCTRLECPNAGAMTHYHNYTYYVQRPILAGGEILVNYGPNWYQERQSKKLLEKVVTDLPLDHGNDDGDSSNSNSHRKPHRDVKWLRQNGICLDSLRPGPRSKIKYAGRGAFSTRKLSKGSIVAPVPVIPVANNSTTKTTTTTTTVMSISRQKERTYEWVHTQQLMLNYCYGHANSSLLLFPYSPIVNLINHASGRTANVRLRWASSPPLPSSSSAEKNQLQELRKQHRNDELLNWPIERILTEQPWGLLLELVAIRDIEPNEEILIDYGKDWVDAWLQHVRQWKAPVGSDHYAPSYVHEDVIKSLRPMQMLKENPYPSNVFTSCFYRYSNSADSNINKNRHGASTNRDKEDDAVTTIRWNQTRGIYELSNLRPCTVLKRQVEKNKIKSKKDGSLFTVQIHNRYGLSNHQRIPRGQVHIVTDVPRRAIKFSDRIYTTDQHLVNAFRHTSVDFGDLYPKQWLDNTDYTNDDVVTTTKETTPAAAEE